MHPYNFEPLLKFYLPNPLKPHSIMADLRIDPRMKVSTFKENFKKAFGASLRVYTTVSCRQPASDDETLGTLMAKTGAKGGTATFGGNLRVGNFEKKINEMFGIGVQVANKDNTALADNEITLVAAGK